MSNFVPVNAPLLDGNEKKYLIECIDSGWISSEGPFVEQFEKLFSKRMGRRYGISVSNGTAAIDVAIEALGITKDDEVILPAFTIISCVNQIIRNGAKPVLVDSDPKTWNMDVSQIEAKITSKTKAIMVVHIYGLPVNIQPVIDIAKKYNLKLIEDAAEMHGQTYNGKPCGSFGDVSIFSFYPNKHITTGEGGMVLTDNEEIANTCKSLRNLCFQNNNRFVHERIGWNLRMTNLQAAIGVAQLERLEEFIIRKRKMGQTYNELLEAVKHIQTPLPKTEYAENIYWVYGIVLDPASKLKAKEAISSLAKSGVGARPFFCPMNKQPVLNKIGLFNRERFPVAESLYDYGFYIPSGIGITRKQIEISAQKLIEVLEQN